jgi:VIT1/CCC1 family predicted Fe2+/Mn2+ transporter
MDAELARVGAVVGQEIAWSPGEIEILETIERDADRRAALERAHAECEDLGAARALKLAQEIRLIEAQTARLVKGLQRELSKLLGQSQSDDKHSAAPASVVSLKAQRAANTRWHRERLRQQAAAVQSREPDEVG